MNKSSGLVIAVSKGRILKDTLPLLEKIGITPSEDPAKSRKLILDTTASDTKIVIIRATDVPTFVEYGAADVGIAGKDVLMEHDGDGFYEPLDLKIAKCKLAVAGREANLSGEKRIRIATKYANTAREYFANKGIQTEIIKLYGSMELAPLVGLSDYIVDLVDTGNTLRANGLVEIEDICDISSRLIVNKASMKLKHQAINALIESLKPVVAES
ncbi:MAG: ATP phosphoribosyltransferase [Gammaproteobacteria bacterium]